LPLSRLDTPTKVCVQLRSRLVGLPRDCRASACFHAAPSGSVELPSPEPASSRFILPWRSSSSEFLRSNHPRASFDGRIPTQGLVPHRGITGARPHLTRDAMPSLRSVLRLSQPLDGFLRPPASRACSIPQPRPGLSPFRGFSPRAAGCLIDSPFLPAVVIPSPHRTMPCSSLSRSACRRLPRSWMPRLRGFAPREAALRTVWG
jgi:hypothetical protein